MREGKVNKEHDQEKKSRKRIVKGKRKEGIQKQLRKRKNTEKRKREKREIVLISRIDHSVLIKRFMLL